ncbi:MAG: DNA recombinase [Eubacteriales bacterium]
MPESQIEQVLVAAINQTWCDKDTFLATLQRNIEAVLESEKSQPLTDVDKRLAELQEELLKRTGARADYEDVAEEIYRLREDKQKLQLESAGRDEQKKRITDMGTFLREQPTALAEYDEPLVRRLVEKVTIYEDKFIVEFKSGVTVDVDE